jgi:O-antigen/teichoic acid export membrane protein
MKLIPDIVLDYFESGDASPVLSPRIAAPDLTVVSSRDVPAGAFAIFDQGVVSGTNFLTTLIIARVCSQEELGVYSLAWTIVLFLAAAQGNLVSVPYTMYCHRHSGEALAAYAGSTLLHQLITSLGAVACILGLDMLLSAGIGSVGVRSAAWVLLGAIPFLLLREYARRLTFAHLALRSAVAIDVLVAVIQLGCLLALQRLGCLSAASAYGAMGAACAVACLYWWCTKTPMRFCRERFVKDWRANWSFGKWALTSQLTGLALYLLPWILAAFHGEAETGELAACGTLVGLSNLFVIGVNNYLMPKAAQAFTQRGPDALEGVLRKATMYSVVVLGGLCVIAFFVGNALAGIVYGAKYGDTGMLVFMLSLATFIDALGLTASTGLGSMDRPSISLVGDVVQLVVTLGCALWLVFPMGAMGIAIAMVAGRAAGAVVRWTALRMLIGLARYEPHAA